MTFIFLGFFLQFFPLYFGNKYVTSAVKIICALIGVLGFAVELGKNKSKIIGIDNLLIGLLLISGWLFLFNFFKHWLINTLSFLVLIIGLFGLFMGMQQVAYSIVRYFKQNKEGEKISFNKDDLLLFLTKLLGVLLVFAQVCKAVLEIKV